MEYKRLTKKGGLNFADKNLSLVDEWGYSHIYKRLAELEDKIEAGTLIELPCKVGDTVWEVSPFSKMPTAITAPNVHTILRWKEDEVFGRELFLTREEAEKRLKELEE